MKLNFKTKTMKKLVFALVLFMSVFFAQAQVSINVNIGTPPSWGPEGNDDSRYYYLPDIDIYYDVAQRQYIYDNNGRWTRDKRLPSRYRNYDLYGGYKVVLTDYHGRTPYTYFDRHRVKYYKGYHGAPQRPYRARPVYGCNDRHDRQDRHRDNHHHDKHHDKHDRHDRDDRGPGHGRR